MEGARRLRGIGRRSGSGCGFSRRGRGLSQRLMWCALVVVVVVVVVGGRSEYWVVVRRGEGEVEMRIRVF